MGLRARDSLLQAPDVNILNSGYMEASGLFHNDSAFRALLSRSRKLDSVAGNECLLRGLTVEQDNFDYPNRCIALKP